MNYWAAETTNMGSALTQSLWDYMQYTWAPRGAYTAEVLYNITRGWVVHNEMNVSEHLSCIDQPSACSTGHAGFRSSDIRV